MRIDNFYSNNYIAFGNNSDRNKALLIKEYLDENKTYLKGINSFKKFDIWELYLTLVIKFISSKDTDEKRNIEIMVYEKADEVI